LSNLAPVNGAVSSVPQGGKQMTVPRLLLRNWKRGRPTNGFRPPVSWGQLKQTVFRLNTLNTTIRLG